MGSSRQSGASTGPERGHTKPRASSDGERMFARQERSTSTLPGGTTYSPVAAEAVAASAATGRRRDGGFFAAAFFRAVKLHPPLRHYARWRNVRLPRLRWERSADGRSHRYSGDFWCFSEFGCGQEDSNF